MKKLESSLSNSLSFNDQSEDANFLVNAENVTEKVELEANLNNKFEDLSDKNDVSSSKEKDSYNTSSSDEESKIS